MAYSDIQNKVGQIQMANRILLAQRMNPNLTPETDLSGFQEQGGYIDQEKIDQLEQYDKDKKTKPVDGKGKVNFRKQLYPPYKGTRTYPKASNDRFKGLNEDQIRAKIAEEDAKRAREAEEERLDQDPELNKQLEDMRQGDYLQDPENPFDINNLMKIGGAAAGFGGNLLRMLINPFGGNALASTPQDGRTPTRLFYNSPYDSPKMFIKDKQTIDDAKKRFKMYTGINLAGRPGYHTTTNGGFVNQAGKVFYNDNGVLRPDGDYDEKIHGALIPPIGLDQAMNNTNNSMKIYG